MRRGAGRGFVPPVVVVARGKPLAVPIAVPVDLQREEGRLECHARKRRAALRHGAASKLTGDRRRQSRQIARIARVSLPLPDLPLGYHTASSRSTPACSGDVANDRHARAMFRSAGDRRGQARSGASRCSCIRCAADDNWGIGDFRDLRELIRLAAPLGCGIIGLNPLHALMPANPAHISPYSPSNRQFLNVLYISVEDVPDFAECEPARKRVAEPKFQATLKRIARDQERRLRARRGREVRNAVAAVREFPHAHLGRRHAARRGFPAVPGVAGRAAAAACDLRRARWALAAAGAAVLGLAELAGGISRSDLVGGASASRASAPRTSSIFYICNGSRPNNCALRRALRAQCGMAIGLYGDVAVGANSAGSETWSNRHLYLQGASVGAPPDALALKGQDWGIPPQDPDELRAQQYQPFIGLVRNNMRYVAALRFDHVMTLYRLWWVPRGLLSKDGAYVHYPLDDLIAILALESERNHCIVIGEDLGTVPEAMTACDGALPRLPLQGAVVRTGRRRSVQAAVGVRAQSARGGDDARLADVARLVGGARSASARRLDLYPSEELRLQAHAARASDRASCCSRWSRPACGAGDRRSRCRRIRRRCRARSMHFSACRTPTSR